MKTFKQLILESEDHIDKWNTIVSNNPLLKGAVEILKKITDKGYEALIVGGAVRDLLTKEKEPDDIDITSNMPIDELEKIFKTHDIGDNKKFNIVVVEYKGNNYEIAGYRTDSLEYTDGRRPDKIEIAKDFKTDTERRDYTINSLGLDQDGKIIDFHGGREDIKNKVIKTVGDPNRRFSEDFLRMLRAIRFSARMGFRIDPDTLKAIKDNADKITGIAAERIFKEIYGMAKSGGERFADAIELLKETGLLKHVFPELSPENLSDILLPLRKSESKDPAVNLSILLHSLSVPDIEKLSSRLKLDTDQKQTLIFVAKNHQKIHDLLGMGQKETMDIIGHKYFDTLFNVFLTNSKTGKVDEKEWENIVNRIEELKNRFKDENSIDNIKKIISGELVMRLRGIKPGPEVGKILNKTLTWVVDNNVDIKNLNKIEDYIKNVNI